MPRSAVILRGRLPIARPMFDRFPAIRARLGATALLVLSIGSAWFLLESLVYRSGAYFSVAEPESNAGAVVRALLVLEHDYRPDARNVLVFGDSRVAEGFPPQGAAGGDATFNFINLAVPGSTARTWYYLLREVDRRGFDFDAVVVGTLYRSTHGQPLADWPLDAAHAARLVGLRDVVSFPATFDDPAMRERARHATLFPALALRQDTLALLESPRARFRDVFETRPAYLEAVRGYPGREENMPGVRFAASGDPVVEWASATNGQRLEVDAILADLAPRPPWLLAANDAFLGKWLGSMAGIARRRGARLIVYPLPRGPYRALLPDHPALPSSLQSLAGEAGVVVLPPDLLAELEAPRFFFDRLHANRAGRERTGAVVGARVREELERDAPP